METDVRTSFADCCDVGQVTIDILMTSSLNYSIATSIQFGRTSYGHRIGKRWFMCVKDGDMSFLDPLVTRICDFSAIPEHESGRHRTVSHLFL
jgi:hypothetical protein